MSSPRKVLVLGGTQFVGKRLVRRCLDAGDDVTLVSRGRAADPFENDVRRVVCDRAHLAALPEDVRTGWWDIIFDQICYGPSEASAAATLFAGKVGKYVFCSSLAVYDHRRLNREEQFDASSLPLSFPQTFSYIEGKRLAEAAFARARDLPVVAVRFPIILGPDDPTGRWEFHWNALCAQAPLVLRDPEAYMSFISSAEAARFLEWVAGREPGAWNGCATGEMTIADLLGRMAARIGKPPRWVVEPKSEAPAPYAFRESKSMCNDKAQLAGFQFEGIAELIARQIEECYARFQTISK